MHNETLVIVMDSFGYKRRTLLTIGDSKTDSAVLLPGCGEFHGSDSYLRPLKGPTVGIHPFGRSIQMLNFSRIWS